MTEAQKKKNEEIEAFNNMTKEEKNEFLEKRVASKKVRCKNWPNCKDPVCEYVHPKETCPYFPTCKFGDKCCYIHPQIPCKFGFRCTRMGCAYTHPQGYQPGMMIYGAGMVPTIPMFKKIKNPEKRPNNEIETKENTNKPQPQIQENESKSVFQKAQEVKSG